MPCYEVLEYLRTCGRRPCFISFTLNRISSKDCSTTPYELSKERDPQLNYFKVWCLAKVKISDFRIRKISSKTFDAMFVGYGVDNNVSRFLVMNSQVSEIVRNTIIEAKDVVYFKNIFPLKSIACPTHFVPLIVDFSSRSVLSPVEEPGRSKRRMI